MNDDKEKINAIKNLRQAYNELLLLGGYIGVAIMETSKDSPAIVKDKYGAIKELSQKIIDRLADGQPPCKMDEKTANNYIQEIERASDELLLIQAYIDLITSVNNVKIPPKIKTEIPRITENEVIIIQNLIYSISETVENVSERLKTI